MGGGGLGFDWRHLFSTLVGYIVSSWNHSDQPVISAIQEAGRTAEQRCLAGVRDHLACPEVTVNQFSFEFKFAFGITLLSVSGSLVVCWHRWCRARSSTAVFRDRVSDDSPTSADERRRLAHRQLAEIRSRSRRDVLAQQKGAGSV